MVQKDLLYRLAHDSPGENQVIKKGGRLFAGKGLFITDQLERVNDGMSVYIDSEMALHDVKFADIFDRKCYVQAVKDYSHVAVVPVDALDPTETDQSRVVYIARRPHRDCWAGKAHALICPTEEYSRQIWNLVRAEMISRAKLFASPITTPLSDGGDLPQSCST